MYPIRSSCRKSFPPRLIRNPRFPLFEPPFCRQMSCLVWPMMKLAFFFKFFPLSLAAFASRLRPHQHHRNQPSIFKFVEPNSTAKKQRANVQHSRTSETNAVITSISDQQQQRQSFELQLDKNGRRGSTRRQRLLKHVTNWSEKYRALLLLMV